MQYYSHFSGSEVVFYSRSAVFAVTGLVAALLLALLARCCIRRKKTKLSSSKSAWPSFSSHGSAPESGLLPKAPYNDSVIPNERNLSFLESDKKNFDETTKQLEEPTIFPTRTFPPVVVPKLDLNRTVDEGKERSIVSRKFKTGSQRGEKLSKGSPISSRESKKSSRERKDSSVDRTAPVGRVG